MKLHLEEYEAAVRYEREKLVGFEGLQADQLRALRQRAQRYLLWLRRYRALHNLVGAGLLVVLLGSDLSVLAFAPAFTSRLFGTDRATLSAQILAGILAGLLHGWLVCSIVTYTVHEGAAHNRIIIGSGLAARTLRTLVNNTPRLFFAVPDHYAEEHAAHHRGLGTRQDSSFTHHVFRRRLMLALLPLAPVLSVSDFIPWRPIEHTKSRKLTSLISNAMMLLSAAIAFRAGGWIYTALSVFVIGAWLSFALDRIREATEHAYMPLDGTNGTRELGIGFFGLLVGGGPWGQPCHLTHHLEPALPWYQQLLLHRHLVALLDESQRRTFLLRPFVGFPALLGNVFVNGSQQRRSADTRS